GAVATGGVAEPIGAPWGVAGFGGEAPAAGVAGFASGAPASALAGFASASWSCTYRATVSRCSPNSLAIRRIDQLRRWSERIASILAILSRFAIGISFCWACRRR